MFTARVIGHGMDVVGAINQLPRVDRVGRYRE